MSFGSCNPIHSTISQCHTTPPHEEIYVTSSVDLTDLLTFPGWSFIASFRSVWVNGRLSGWQRKSAEKIQSHGCSAVPSSLHCFTLPKKLLLANLQRYVKRMHRLGISEPVNTAQLQCIARIQFQDVSQISRYDFQETFLRKFTRIWSLFQR